MNVPTPLIILETIKDGVRKDASRYRPVAEFGADFYGELHTHLCLAAIDNPDEIIVRFLRPVVE